MTQINFVSNQLKSELRRHDPATKLAVCSGTCHACAQMLPALQNRTEQECLARSLQHTGKRSGPLPTRNKFLPLGRIRSLLQASRLVGALNELLLIRGLNLHRCLTSSNPCVMLSQLRGVLSRGSALQTYRAASQIDVAALACGRRMASDAAAAGTSNAAVPRAGGHASDRLHVDGDSAALDTQQAGRNSPLSPSDQPVSEAADPHALHDGLASFQRSNISMPYLEGQVRAILYVQMNVNHNSYRLVGIRDFNRLL